MIKFTNSEFATKIGQRERYTLLGINIMTYGIYVSDQFSPKMVKPKMSKLSNLQTKSHNMNLTRLFRHFSLQGILGGSFGVALDTLLAYFNIDETQYSAGLSVQAIGGCISAFLG